MMILVSDILDSARLVLSDKNKDRWDDDTLISLLNDGIEDFVSETKVTKIRKYILLEDMVSTYNMSDYVLSIDRITYEGTPLISKSEEEMDNLKDNWEDEIGAKPIYAIFDNLNIGTFRIAPLVTGANNVPYTQNQVYGAVVDITLTNVLAEIPTDNLTAIGTRAYLAVSYTEKPTKVVLLADQVNMPNIYKPALAAYVSGQALRLDQDTLNRQFGAEQIGIYDTYVAKASAKEAKANNTFHNRQIPYKGFQ